MLGLDFHVIFIFCLHCALYKIHTWKLFVYEKIFAHGKINQQKKVLGKKKIKIKNRPKLRKKGYHSVKQRKNSFVKTTCTGGASHWCLDFEQRSHC